MPVQTEPKEHKQENGLINILINVIIPVIILNKLSLKIGPANALMLALAFPIGYGIYDFIKRRKINWFSLLGLINVLVTGSLALLGINGFWFAVKEAVFPFLIGLFVFLSSHTEKPFVQTLLLNPQLMNLDALEQKLKERDNEFAFRKHIRVSTRMLSTSFFLSAVFNFLLARHIFIPLDSSLTDTAKSVLLNEQIAKMTSYAIAVIMIPSVAILSFILWHLLKGIRDLTGLKTDEILKN